MNIDQVALWLSTKSVQPPYLRLRLLAVLIFLALSSPANARALVGAVVPTFSWTDTDGRSARLDDYRGRIVVLEWTSPVCPYSQYRYDTGIIQHTQEQILNQGGVWLTLLSAGRGQSGYMTVSESRKMQKMHHAHPTAVIRDTDSRIARMLGATTTPHIAVINIDGVLVYSGGFDSSPAPWEEDGPVKNYVLETLQDLRAGRPVRVPITRAYGCMIHYAR